MLGDTSIGLLRVTFEIENLTELYANGLRAADIGYPLSPDLAPVHTRARARGGPCAQWGRHKVATLRGGADVGARLFTRWGSHRPATFTRPIADRDPSNPSPKKTRARGPIVVTQNMHFQLENGERQTIVEGPRSPNMENEENGPNYVFSVHHLVHAP